MRHMILELLQVKRWTDRQTDMVKVMGKILQHTSVTHKEVGVKKILSQIHLHFLVQIYNLVFSFCFADRTKFN
jgi:hypothetical protein